MPAHRQALSTPRGATLRDSHMLSEAPTVLHGSELVKASEHNDGSGLAVVSGPAAEPGADPGGEGEGALGMGVFLFLGLAFELRRYRLERGLLVRLEDIRERPLGGPVALLHQLKHADGGDQRRSGKLFERAFGDAHALDVEAPGLQRAEQLLDQPAPAIKPGDPSRRGEVADLVGGQQPPMSRLDTVGRIDLARFDEVHGHALRQHAPIPAVAGTLDRGFAKAHRQHRLARRPARSGRGATL